jgi:hypothetical protein
VNDDRNANPASPAEQLRLDEELAARFQHALAGERLGVPLQAVVRRARRHRRRRSWRRSAQPQLAVALALIAVMVAAAVTLRAHDLAQPQPPAIQPQPPASTMFSVPSFQSGIQGWTSFPGTLFSRGELGKPGTTYARIEQDPVSRPDADPDTGLAMVGVKAGVLDNAARGTQLRATVRLRTTRPGVTVLLRLSRWEGSQRVDFKETRTTLPDTGWHQVPDSYQVAASGSTIYLEIWAIGLGPDAAVFADHPTVTSP